MSLKSHYGWGSAPAKTDFLWFCCGGEEMREAKSLRSKIQMDTAGREGNALKHTAPTASFHHGGVPCLAVISETQCDREMWKLPKSQTRAHSEGYSLHTETRFYTQSLESYTRI